MAILTFKYDPVKYEEHMKLYKPAITSIVYSKTRFKPVSYSFEVDGVAEAPAPKKPRKRGSRGSRGAS